MGQKSVKFQGVRMIAQERKRQIKEKGWDLWHDKITHKKGDLALAGACYALNAASMALRGDFIKTKKEYKRLSHQGVRWPFEQKYWRPSGVLRDLIKAAALIAAEIDRLVGEESGYGG